MKEKYTNASIDVIEFDSNDIISTSGGSWVCTDDTKDDEDCLVVS